MLALAHRIDRMVRDGEFKDLADAARAIGVTRARMTQIVNLTLLAPEIQEGILEMTVRVGKDLVSERLLRRIVAEPLWRRHITPQPGGTPHLTSVVFNTRLSASSYKRSANSRA